jgi:hypothetical protein
MGVDGGNLLGSLIFNPNPLFGSWRELEEGIGEGIHVLCLVCEF